MDLDQFQLLLFGVEDGNGYWPLNFVVSGLIIGQWLEPHAGSQVLSFAGPVRL